MSSAGQRGASSRNHFNGLSRFRPVPSLSLQRVPRRASLSDMSYGLYQDFVRSLSFCVRTGVRPITGFCPVVVFTCAYRCTVYVGILSGRCLRARLQVYGLCRNFVQSPSSRARTSVRIALVGAE